MTEKKMNPVFNYFIESAVELKKVTWPTGNRAVRLTIVVLSFCIATGIFIALADWLFNFGYGQLVDYAGSI
jgi:preprotein translocase SecE subunit